MDRQTEAEKIVDKYAKIVSDLFDGEDARLSEVMVERGRLVAVLAAAIRKDRGSSAVGHVNCGCPTCELHDALSALRTREESTNEPELNMLDKVKIVDQSRETHPEPCGDCGRTHLKGEHVAVSVPTPDNDVRIVWWGCIDCWLRRTSPDHRNTT